MEEHPFDTYLTALEAYQAGSNEVAAEEVAKALGGEEATEPIRASLDVIFDKETPLHASLINAITSEVRRRKYRKT